MNKHVQPQYNYRSPNFEDSPINVEFVLIHYTAGDFKRALSHFLKPGGVSCHLLIKENGKVFELVDCWNSTAKRAFHAGESRLEFEGEIYSDFNKFSLGIELVNLNGNLLPYSDEQYEALCSCLKHLMQKYPAIKEANRVFGHEHVAGDRGKADPGILFDWKRVFSLAYPGQPVPSRNHVCPSNLADVLRKFLKVIPPEREKAVDFWHALSATTEAAIELCSHPPLQQEERGKIIS